uniref:ISXO2-like transposase domain-containing protein n=1 Tax=Sipha flava TaxID=143950 RepID=A0A2S2QAX3_9HEMI
MNCPSIVIQKQLRLANQTVVDWSSFCREVVFDHMMKKKKKKLKNIGEVVEIDESEFGRRKYHRGHRVEGQWVFGDYERGSEDCFLIPVEDRSAEALVRIIEEWITPGTTIISNCWKAYSRLNEKVYNHFTVNHSVNFKDPETGAHSNTIESTWHHAKVTLPNYKRKKEFYGRYLAIYIFLKKFRNHELDPTVQFFNTAGSLYSVHNNVENVDV